MGDGFLELLQLLLGDLRVRRGLGLHAASARAKAPFGADFDPRWFALLSWTAESDCRQRFGKQLAFFKLVELGFHVIPVWDLWGFQFAVCLLEGLEQLVVLRSQKCIRDALGLLVGLLFLARLVAH